MSSFTAYLARSAWHQHVANMDGIYLKAQKLGYVIEGQSILFGTELSALKDTVQIRLD